MGEIRPDALSVITLRFLFRLFEDKLSDVAVYVVFLHGGWD